MEPDTLPDPEFEHAAMGLQLPHHLQPCHDAVVQLDELRLTQVVNVDRHGVAHHCSSRRADVVLDRFGDRPGDVSGSAL
jgi:hypothetical protein